MTVGQWNRYYGEASLVEESWPDLEHFLKIKKMPSIALADLGKTAQPTSRAVVEASNVINDPKCNKVSKCNNFWS